MRAPLQLWDLGLLGLVLIGVVASLGLHASPGVQAKLVVLGPIYALVRGGIIFGGAIRALRPA